MILSFISYFLPSISFFLSLSPSFPICLNIPAMEGNYTFRQAGPEDASVIMELINDAFAIELKYFSKERIDLAGVADHLQKGTFIMAVSGAEPVGCVYTELRGEQGYFGLL